MVIAKVYQLNLQSVTNACVVLRLHFVVKYSPRTESRISFSEGVGLIFDGLAIEWMELVQVSKQ